MASIDEAKHIHLIGIGGCSMSGLAQILKAQGHVVSGSDREETQFTGHLRALGIPYNIGHTGEYLKDADLVIYSAAIKAQNPERILAKSLAIPELERSVALGQLSARFADVVAIAGCHGKTTITSMLAAIFADDPRDPTIHVGGLVESLGGGVHVGKKEIFITEACEYVRSFLTLKPTVALINNIDNDHLDCYRDIDEIAATFRDFVELLPEDGLFLACTDDERVRALYETHLRNGRSYGLNAGDYHAGEIRYDEAGSPSFTLIAFDKPVGRVTLHVPGTHNVINALAAYAVADAFHVDFASYERAICGFANTRRRFERMGERNGVVYYHDYAHHPGEIAATMEAASRVPHKQLYCVFQCNSYTRAKTLFCGDMRCLSGADTVLVPDIYPGREQDDGSVHARDMVAAINRSGGNAIYLGSFEAIRDYLDVNGQPGDLVITLGSGDVYNKTAKVLLG